MGTRPAIFGATSKSQIWTSGEARHTRTTSTTLTEQEGSSTRDGEMRLYTASLLGSLRIRARSIGSVISATNTSPSSIAPILQSALAASLVASQTVTHGSIRKTADPIGSSTWGWVECLSLVIKLSLTTLWRLVFYHPVYV
jgi:hypothetical protein